MVIAAVWLLLRIEVDLAKVSLDTSRVSIFHRLCLQQGHLTYIGVLIHRAGHNYTSKTMLCPGRVKLYP